MIRSQPPVRRLRPGDEVRLSRTDDWREVADVKESVRRGRIRVRLVGAQGYLDEAKILGGAKRRVRLFGRNDAQESGLDLRPCRGSTHTLC